MFHSEPEDQLILLMSFISVILNSTTGNVNLQFLSRSREPTEYHVFYILEFLSIRLTLFMYHKSVLTMKRLISYMFGERVTSLWFSKSVAESRVQYLSILLCSSDFIPSDHSQTLIHLQKEKGLHFTLSLKKNLVNFFQKFSTVFLHLIDQNCNTNH